MKFYNEHGWAAMRLKIGFLCLFFLCVGSLLEEVAAQNDVVGRWSQVPDLPFFPVHTHVLPTGKVMFWGSYTSGNDVRLWDPATATVSSLPTPGYNIFCSGHAFMADGRLFAAGGHVSDHVGLPNVSIYNPSTNVWTSVPNMNAGRWYPTAITLANGDMLVVSGDIDGTVGENVLPQVFQSGSGSWRSLTNAQIGLDLYPRMHLAPNGRVFNSAPSTVTRYLDTSGSGAWTVVASHSVNIYRDYAPSVMYDNGKVLVMGGGDPPTNTAEVIDLNAASPAWRTVAPMAFARRQHNATILPDGKVLVTGGTSGPGFNNDATIVFAAEMWDPATEQWTTLASQQFQRIYHSGAVLLPDGRVLTVGGDNIPQTEVYEPPYLFKGARPTINSAPASVNYGQTFFVDTPNAASITQVTWIRLSSVTHAFNMNQQINRLSFSQAAGGLNVMAPSNANLAPPGYYMLFILNGNGVPSEAKIVQITSTGAPSPGTLQFSAATYSVAENGSTATITITRTGGSAGAVGVTFATSNGTATAGQDYTAVTPTVISFGNGDTANKTVSIPILEDTTVEGNETVNLALTTPTGGATLGSPSTAVLTITDNDGGTTLSASPTTVAPGGTITATWSGITAPTARDWIGLYTPGAANTAFIDWIYVSCTKSSGAAQASGSCPFVVPSTVAPGTYQLRLLPDNGFTLLATSNNFTVGVGGGAGSLQFSAATFSVAENGGNATITITRTGGSAGAVGVTFATSNGTATAGQDYTAVTPPVISFGNGDTANKTVSIPILEDTTVEGNETVNLALTSPTGGATLGSPSTAVLTITDNDAAGTLQFSAATYSVAENGGNATITITRTGGSAGAVGVTFATSNGTATAGQDYTAVTPTVISFGNGDTANKTVSIPILEDTTVEGNETVNLALTSPTGGATLGSPSTAVLTITDNDAAGTLQFSAATYSIAENGGNATITITRTGGSAGAVGVTFATSNGTATAPADYTAVNQTVSFANGDTANKTVSIPIVNDTSVEPNETINLALTSPTGGATLGSPSTAVLTITDNDGGTTLSASPTTVAPGGTITATWSGITAPTARDWIGLYTPGAANTAFIDWIYVSCTKSSGAAQASGSCSFVVPSTVAPGTYQLRLLPDNGFTLLATSNNFTVGVGGGAGSLQFSAATFSVAENGGNATITITRTGGSAGAVGVTFATSNGTATAPADYTAVNQTVSFANGDTANKTVSIPIVNDTSVEPNETINLALTSPTGGATLGSPNTAVLTITDNDGGTTLSASPTTVAPGGTITATWSGIANPTALDWIGLYTPGAANTAFIDWIYVSCTKSSGAAQASGSCPFVVPSTVAPGTYQLRLLPNNGFTLLATSNNFTVQ